MNQARGFASYVDPDGRTRTYETFTCCHCNRAFKTPPPGAAEMGFCFRCDKRECVSCAKMLGGRCTPFERRLEQHEQRQRMLVSITG